MSFTTPVLPPRFHRALCIAAVSIALWPLAVNAGTASTRARPVSPAAAPRDPLRFEEASRGEYVGPYVPVSVDFAPQSMGRAASLRAPPDAAEAAASGPVRIVALGDSLTAGLGLPASQSFPEVLQRLLRADGVDAVVVNAGVSGDTSAAGRARLSWTLAEGADVVILELGANDALRGLDPAAMEANLDAILRELRDRGIRVVLAGMRAPRNLGNAYTRRYDAVFPRLAERHGVPFYPFFLEGVAGVPGLNQTDGIHPNAQGVEEIARRIAPLVRRVAAERPQSRER